MTQRELADKLNVTDKAILKWETGWCFLLFLIVVVILCLVLIFRIQKLEKELKP